MWYFLKNPRFGLFGIILLTKEGLTQLRRDYTGGLDLSYLSMCISLLIKDITRLWPNHTVQTSNMQYAFEVKVYVEVLYLEFYLVFSEQFINYVPVKMESSTQKK